MRASSELVRSLGGVAALALIAVAGAPAVQVRDAAVVKGQVAYTRVWQDTRQAHTWISVSNLAGKGRFDITRRPGKNASSYDHSPVWSADGSRLAFVREGKNGSGLYVADRDGTGLRRVLPLTNVRYPDARYPEYGASDFSWSPDGQRLAFAYGHLDVVSADGTRSRRLLSSSACKPSWSLDGRSLVYLMDDSCRSDRGSNEWVPGYSSIYRIDADGSHRRLLANGSFGDAAWSPDGRRIAFTETCAVAHGGDWGCSLSLMNADGSGKQRVVKGTWGGGDWGVEWVAGGKELLWPDGAVFRATNVATGQTHRVLPSAYEDGRPVGTSRDGQKIAVLATSPYSIRNSQHPVPPLIVITLSGRLIQKITVPRGWEARAAQVYLR